MEETQEAIEMLESLSRFGEKFVWPVALSLLTLCAIFYMFYIVVLDNGTGTAVKQRRAESDRAFISLCNDAYEIVALENRIGALQKEVETQKQRTKRESERANRWALEAERLRRRSVM